MDFLLVSAPPKQGAPYPSSIVSLGRVVIIPPTENEKLIRGAEISNQVSMDEDSPTSSAFVDLDTVKFKHRLKLISCGQKHGVPTLFSDAKWDTH